ncbi:MAG TPA: hypothetical protein VGN20_20450 [Mucilaginibacter sp.]|jgi:hypothetical protein
MKPVIKTNNDPIFLQGKVLLRIQSLPDKKEIKVLEAFGGEGVLWGMVKERCPDRTIRILSMDKNLYKKVQLQGDNLKFLKGMNLNEFDIIDLDAWGCPAPQLEIVFKKQYRGVIHCTMIQTMLGALPNIVLEANGYSKAMFRKIKSIFYKDGITKFLNYLSFNGVKKVNIISHDRKNYLWFNLDK